VGKSLKIGLVGLILLVGGYWLLASLGPGETADAELLNVSYDPTRELWRDLNAKFVERYEQETGKRLAIRQSHGASSSQARAVIDGLEADVVTLSYWPDTDALRRKGLIDEDWEGRFPHRSLPYYSTIVFVVRKARQGEKPIRDWPDLVKPGVEVITPNPKTSGNGKHSFLAAWGAVRQRGGSEEDALRFVTQLYRQVPVLETGARGATVTFAQKKIGDVHLTWENEAALEVQEARGELEIVYPPLSIRAEPHVAVVDAVARRKGTEQAAEAYLQFLYTDEGQGIIGRHHYRPVKAEVRKQFADRFPEITLFPYTAVANSWDEVHEKFFAEGAVFDQMYAAERR
jgi:sulfate transport system substrate-binding protein